ncbi:phosphatidate cytidylyltransferase [Rhodoferax sp.]|uniref:phosphatidate cytidylyltransferase n=1 Tax=Rhodoferax sp. TaxID=50421 RepID=UPI00284F0E25|nr:phosphatidate cytidylyltransferase [Rhodoferax sp.]MDR3369739.1 phosphatidate cytidylyltransferase [Rhodoferax sp.]
MLRQRVLTALVLLMVLLPALFYGQPEPFFLIAGVFIAAGAWEWARMNGMAMTTSLGAGALCAMICAGLWWSGWLTEALPRVWLVAGSFWVLVGAWILKAGVPAWANFARPVRLVLGLTVLCVTWLAVAQARLRGVNFLLSVLALVWMADIGAYFSGRALGGRFSRKKLAASISPGKSWEGVWGGMLGVMLMALIWRFADAAGGATVPSFYTLLGGRGLSFMLMAVVFMAAMSVVGDLVESLVKRSAGVKDSSALLPGHGGVLDRVDALLPTLPLAMMLISF